MIFSENRYTLCADAAVPVRIMLLLQGLAVLGNVQALELMLLRDPQRHEEADELQDRVGDARAPDQRDDHAIELD